jgi:predicted RNA-binding protein YlqC (UPF0109 family)
MAENFADQQFIETVIKFIVDHPEDVRTERVVDEMGVLITLYINSADMGQVIGRSGRTARAIRVLARVVGAKHNARVNLKIYEPEGSRSFNRPRYQSSGADSSTSSSASVDEDDDLKL